MDIEKILKMYEEINLKKAELANTDYQCLKFAEGELTVSEYAPIKEQRRQLRAEINELESKLMERTKNG